MQYNRDCITVNLNNVQELFYQETCAKVIHYRAEWWRDFVPRIDSTGARREHDSVITLSSDPNASLFDHEFMSPTYQEHIQWHILNYIKTAGNTL